MGIKKKFKMKLAFVILVCIDIVASISCFQTISNDGMNKNASCAASFDRCSTLITTFANNGTTHTWYNCATAQQCSTKPENYSFASFQWSCCSTDYCNQPSGAAFQTSANLWLLIASCFFMLH